MNGGFGLHDELAAGVRDAAGAWRFIRLFAAEYASPIASDDGCDDDELREAESRLGVAVPASLRDGYALLGKRDDLTRHQDYLAAPEQMQIDDTGRVLVFRYENQSVTEWGVPLSALHEPDPPVVFRYLSPPSTECMWKPYLDRVSLAWVEMVLSEWMLAGGLHCDNRDLDAGATASLERQFRRLPMPDYPMRALPGGEPTRWFCGYDAVLRVDGGQWLWVRARSHNGIAAVRRALPGDWLGATTAACGGTGSAGLGWRMAWAEGGRPVAALRSCRAPCRRKR